MKNWIRKWLGITELSDSVASIPKYTQEDLRKHVGKAFVEALDNKTDENPDYYGYFSESYRQYETRRNVLRTAINSAVTELSERQTTTVRSEAQKYVESEAFIKSVVERINKMQVKK